MAALATTWRSAGGRARGLLGALVVGALVLGAGHGAAARGAIEAHPALWKVTGERNAVYLFGSIHLLPNDALWTSATVNDAMRDSQVFVFESPDEGSTDPQMRRFILQRGVFHHGQKLRALLSPAAQNEFDKRISEFGFVPSRFDNLNPWLASIVLKVTFLEDLGYSPEAGADTQIADYAHANKRQFRYLESPDVGLEPLYVLGQKTGIANVEATLADMDDMPETLDDLIAHWRVGDIDGLSRDIDQSLDQYPKVGRLLLTDRNRNWSSAINKMTKLSRDVFVTVGIAHLAGRDSLVEQLCAQGLAIARIDGPAPVNACPQS